MYVLISPIFRCCFILCRLAESYSERLPPEPGWILGTFSAVFAQSQFPGLCPLLERVFLVLRGIAVIKPFIKNAAVLFVHCQGKDGFLQIRCLAQEADTAFLQCYVFPVWFCGNHMHTGEKPFKTKKETRHNWRDNYQRCAGFMQYLCI